MKIKQLSKMKPSISKTILFFGCLFAVISLYGQESALSVSSEPAQSAEGPFILKRESSAPAQQATAQPVAQSASNVKADAKADTAKVCGKHQFSIWGAGGASSLMYSPSFGDRSLGFGGAFGLGYTYYFSPKWGILLGAELAFYNAKMEVDGLIDMYPIEDPLDGRPVDFYSNFSNYEEKQRMMNVNIPIALQFETGEKHKFFASLGFKFGIPVSGGYTVANGSTLKTYGYYTDLNQWFYDPTYLGYGTFKGDDSEKDLDFNLSYMGTVEAGVRWRLSQVWSLYTGLYFEYGFNNIVDENTNQFLAYNNTDPANFTVNSTLTSQYTQTRDVEVQDRKTESFADRVSPMAVGLKVRLAMDVCKKPKAPKEETPAPVAPKKAEPKPPVVVEEEVEDTRPVRTLRDEDIIEDLRRLVSEYGSSVRGAITIELEGYELDQSKLTPRMEALLDSKVDQIRQMHGTDISIIAEGHTCDVGNEAYNMRLGQKRAEIVRNFLISRGFKADKVIAVSKGQSSPIVPNTNEANRKKNRRVVLIVRD